MEKSKFGVCPLFTFEKIISGKWMLPVLRCLEQNDGIRFGALLRCFPEITKATLTKQNARPMRQRLQNKILEHSHDAGAPFLTQLPRRAARSASGVVMGAMA